MGNIRYTNPDELSKEAAAQQVSQLQERAEVDTKLIGLSAYPNSDTTQRLIETRDETQGIIANLTH